MLDDDHQDPASRRRPRVHCEAHVLDGVLRVALPELERALVAVLAGTKEVPSSSPPIARRTAPQPVWCPGRKATPDPSYAGTVTPPSPMADMLVGAPAASCEEAVHLGTEHLDRAPPGGAKRAAINRGDRSTADQEVVSRTFSRSSTRRTSSKTASTWPFGKRICVMPTMFENSSQPSSSSTIARANPSRPWNRPTS